LVAIFGLGFAILALLLYGGMRVDGMQYVALGAGVMALLASLSYFIERGKRLTQLAARWSAVGESELRAGGRCPVAVEIDGEVLQADIWEENDTWHLEWDKQHLCYEPSRVEGNDLMADQALKQFVRDELQPRGVRLRCCGTCAYFSFSGMSKQMSGGRMGYCLRHTTGPLTPEHDAVHIWQVCPDWDTAPQGPKGSSCRHS